MSESILPSDTVSTNGHGDPQTSQAAPDPFDPARLRLSQDFAATIGVTKALLTVPVRKPDKSWFVQVHPGESYRISTAVIELKEDRETYLCDQSLWPDLATEPMFQPRALFTAITRQGVIFLWPVRLPGADGKLDEWSRSALEAATMAEGHWCRVVADMQIGGYSVYKAAAELAAPTWPEESFHDLLRIAFRDRVIDSLSHPVIRKLRGLV